MRRALASSIIFSLWLASMGTLVAREVLPVMTARPASSILWEEFPLFKDYWLSLYYEDEKIGYTHVWTFPLEAMGEKGYEIRHQTFLRMMMLGETRFIEWTSSTQLDSAKQPVRFDFRLSSGPYRMRLAAKRIPAGWSLEIAGTHGVLERREIQGQPDFFPATHTGAFLSLMEWDRQRAVTFSLFDPFTQSSLPVSIRMLASEERMWKGKRRRIYELETQVKGMRMKSWVTEDGDLVREESPMGFVAVHEAMESAVSSYTGVPAVDLAKVFAIPSNRILDRPRETDFLKLKMIPVDFDHLFPAGARQKILDRTKGLVEIHRVRFPERTLDTTAPGSPDAERWLEPSAFVHSRHEKIVKTAKSITGGEKDPVAKAKKILRWVHRHVKPTPTLSVPSSLDVLAERKGDCNEYTVLFTALARASGVPTRMMAGLVYLDGYFVYHAWPEVFAGGWIAVDPTLGEESADATHIGLVEGDLLDQLQLLALIGKLEVEILETGENP